ncbi:hypothetical protein BKA62DRAFT_720700 [Auriculariales sp. MPI-PUGE-AT-0066]|nr:hypothetical protein BKA62DRAFT_720700 [Auriculariales sp. MPI-PUGE-AT-0066]
MSFAALRNARKTRDSKSVLKPPTRLDSGGESSQHSVHPITSAWPVASSDPYSLPETLNIRLSPHAGRTLVAQSAFRRGQVILAMKPHTHVLSNQHIASFCATCGSPSTHTATLKRCSGCAVTHYCSSNCQTADWKHHKVECGDLAQWAKEVGDEKLRVPDEAVRCLGRMLRSRKRNGPDSSWTNQVAAMQSLRSSLPPSSAESHTRLAHSVVKYLRLRGPQDLSLYGIGSAGDLVDVVSRFTTNSFTLSSPSLDPIGVCVSPGLALANHSCAPNAVVVFPRHADTPREREPVMALVALCDMAPGDEILTSYIDISQPRHLRQSQLLGTYGFTCTCTLCSTTSEALPDARWCVLCPRNCGGRCSLPNPNHFQDEAEAVVCNTCKASYPVEAREDLLDRIRIGDEALQKATVLQDSDPSKALSLTKGSLSLLTALVPPSSHPVLGLLRLHVSILIATGALDGQDANANPLLDEAIDTAMRSQSGMQDAFPVGHPVRGVALAELGKMLAVDVPQDAIPRKIDDSKAVPPPGVGRLRLAVKTLVHARAELAVGFGGGNSEIVQVVEEMMKSIERELDVWNAGLRNIRNTS